MKGLRHTRPRHHPACLSRVLQFPQERHFIIGDRARGHKAMAIHVVFLVLSLRSSVVHPHLHHQGSFKVSFISFRPHIGQERIQICCDPILVSLRRHPPERCEPPPSAPPWTPHWLIRLRNRGRRRGGASGPKGNPDIFPAEHLPRRLFLGIAGITRCPKRQFDRKGGESFSGRIHQLHSLRVNRPALSVWVAKDTVPVPASFQTTWVSLEMVT